MRKSCARYGQHLLQSPNLPWTQTTKGGPGISVCVSRQCRCFQRTELLLIISQPCEIVRVDLNVGRSGTCFSKKWLDERPRNDDRKAVLKNGPERVSIRNLRHAPRKVGKRPPVYLRENGGFDSSAAAFPWTAQSLSSCFFLGKESYSLVNFCLETTTPVTKNQREQVRVIGSE